MGLNLLFRLITECDDIERDSRTDDLKQPTFEAISKLLQEFGFHVRHCEFVEAFVRRQRGRAKSAETERISDDRLSEILSPKMTWILEASIFE
jgi:hypothetical protein